MDKTAIIIEKNNHKSNFQELLQISNKRVVVGILKGLDQVVNVVLANTEERVFTPEGVDRQALGLYLIRGDNVAVVGNYIIF